MKKVTKWIIIMGIMVLFNFIAKSQVSVLGNAGTAANYVGWNPAQNFPVRIEHKGNEQINFYTNGNQRMIIDNGGTGNNQGRIAIGNNLATGFKPLDRLHLFQQGGDNYIRFTQNGTVNNGFQIGIANNGNAEIRQSENTPINFFTANTQRMTILGTGANAGNVGIFTTNPQSLLHIGDDVIAGGAGWRSWMKNGSFTCETSDNIYVGLKDEGGFNKKDAVINWGDDPSGFPVGPDNLRFIFTASAALGGTAGSADGLEAMRMTPSSVQGVFTGIGGDPTINLYRGSGINPTNTLEINSPNLTSVVGGSSGLRFTNLDITSPTIANPGPGLLSVDANGDVIYVPDGGSGNIGIYVPQHKTL